MIKIKSILSPGSNIYIFKCVFKKPPDEANILIDLLHFKSPRLRALNNKLFRVKVSQRVRLLDDLAKGLIIYTANYE